MAASGAGPAQLGEELAAALEGASVASRHAAIWSCVDPLPPRSPVIARERRDVVPHRGLGERLPVCARQRRDLLAQPETSRFCDVEVMSATASTGAVAVAATSAIPRAALSVSNVTTRTARSPGTPAAASSATLAVDRRTSPASRSRQRGQRPTPASEVRDRLRHVVARGAASAGTTSCRAPAARWCRSASATALRRRPCCPAPRMASHIGTSPNTTARARYARTTAGGLGAGGPHSRCNVPTRLIMLFSTCVAMISRDSGCFFAYAASAPAAPAGNSAADAWWRSTGRRAAANGWLVVEPDLLVGEEHRGSGGVRPAARRAPRGDRRPTEDLDGGCSRPFFSRKYEPRLRVEEMRRDAVARHRQHLRLEVVVAQHQRRDVVGHLASSVLRCFP